MKAAASALRENAIRAAVKMLKAGCGLHQQFQCLQITVCHAFHAKNSFLSPYRQQIFRLLGNKKRGFASYSKLEKKQTLFVYDVVQMISRMV